MSPSQQVPADRQMLPDLQILPIGRVKRIIKMESDVKAVSAEASYAVARATVRLHHYKQSECDLMMMMSLTALISDAVFRALPDLPFNVGLNTSAAKFRYH